MKKVFMCSLCHNGIVGGGLYLEPEMITYKCQKLAINKKYRNLVLPLKDIKEVEWKKTVFHIAIFRMKNGEEYRMIIYNKARFCKCFDNIVENKN